MDFFFSKRSRLVLFLNVLFWNKTPVLKESFGKTIVFPFWVCMVSHQLQRMSALKKVSMKLFGSQNPGQIEMTSYIFLV